MNLGVGSDKLFHPAGLMSREIVCDQMNLLATWLIGDQFREEGDKFLTGVARGGFAHHFAAFGVKRGVQRKGAVAIVFKAVALEPSGRQRQHRIKPVQGLDGGFFVHAKHRRCGGLT
jgi:hypothetical protein